MSEGRITSVSVETAREIARLREDVETWKALADYWMARFKEVKYQRVTPPPDAPSAPEDVDRITGAPRIGSMATVKGLEPTATIGFAWEDLEVLKGLPERVAALEEWYASCEIRRALHEDRGEG